MSIKTKTHQFRIETNQLISEYKEIISHTYEFLKDSKDWLEYKRVKRKVDGDIYSIKLKSLINMALVYFYSLYEGFTTRFFKKLTMNDFEIDEAQFKKQYPRFHDIVEKLMKRVYKFYIPKRMYSVIMLLREARHNIAHGEKNAKSEFGIIEICYHTLLEYFHYVENRRYTLSKSVGYRKFTE